MKCKCHADSPFHWKANNRPSIFLKDKGMRLAAQSSISQTAVIERERLNGNVIGLVTQNTLRLKDLNVRQFMVYSRAVSGSK